MELEVIVTTDSEALTDEEHKFKVKKGRVAIIKPLMTRIVGGIVNHISVLNVEQHKYYSELNGKVATHYVNKMLTRVSHLLQGEDIGSMLESEFENLAVDEEFEDLRHNLEVPSSLEDEDEEPDLRQMMTVRSYESFVRK